MATNNTVNVTFGGGTETTSIAAGGTATSDDITLNGSGDAHSFFLQVKADNDGTPADGDEIEVYLNAGADPDADATTDFDSEDQADLMMVLNTNESDPAVRSRRFPGPLPDTAQMHFVNKSGGRSITVSAVMIEQFQS